MIDRRPIPSYAGYEADEDGQIWSNTHDRPLTRFLPTGDVIPRVCMTLVNNERRRVKRYRTTIAVHTLIMLTFHAPKPVVGNRCIVGHLDGDPQNCKAANLYWIVYAPRSEEDVAGARPTTGPPGSA